MKSLIITVMLLLLPMTAQADDWNDWSWSKGEIALEVASAALTVIDWGQTRDIRNHSGMLELNPVLGKYPSSRAINYYFGTVLTVRPIVSMLLPKPARKALQYIYIGVETAVISSNYNCGLRMSF